MLYMSWKVTVELQKEYISMPNCGHTLNIPADVFDDLTTLTNQAF